MTESVFKKALAGAIALLLLHAAFYLGVPRGEFWPLSRYPMFSRGARPWFRFVCIDLPTETDFEWRRLRYEELPGKHIGLGNVGLDLMDFTQSMRRALDSDVGAGKGVLDLMRPLAETTSRLAVFRAEPGWAEGGPVFVEYEPMALVEGRGGRVTLASGDR